jgi:hypothetical protein
MARQSERFDQFRVESTRSSNPTEGLSILQDDKSTGRADLERL